MERGYPSEDALDRLLLRERPRDEVRARATDSFYSALRWQAKLDYLIHPHLSRPLLSLDPPVRAALRLGALDLIFHKRPAYASVHEAVEVMKVLSPRAQGFVNAVLRRLADAPQRPLPHDPALALEADLSHPAWLAERWLERLGEERARKWMVWDNTRPDLTLRVNRRKGTPDDYLATFETVGRPHPASPAALAVPSLPIHKLPGFADGWVSVQGPGSQAVTDLVPLRPGTRLADVCSGLGTKSLAFLEREVSLQVLSMDLDPRKLSFIPTEAERLGLPVPEVMTADAKELPSSLNEGFDVVFVDAPCTGLGTLRRHPEIRWRRQAKDLLKSQELQIAILNGARRLVREGGLLVYTVCSTEPEETTEVRDDFLARHAGWKGHPFTQAGKEALFLTPDLDDTEGFYIAQMKRI